MRALELLAPARNADIGIAAIDCGADAVYIAGPAFGARQAAGNSLEDIRRLCLYAHRFGVRIYVTLNTILYDNELEDAYRFMLDAQEAGADGFIVQDFAVLRLADGGPDGTGPKIRIPLHASTQCAIRTPEQARFHERLGFSRLVPERELSLAQIREIAAATDSEIECFVHGALCVCYSGQCYLSEHLARRSANRGACMQACRSRYDLADASGKILVRDKALLSLRDLNLRDRLTELAEAGVCSFKIEGRLKNISYVRNVVRDYSAALDTLVAAHPDRYRRASFGHAEGGFVPDLSKTFNRGYTQLCIDGRRGRDWAATDTPKGMGEIVGTVREIRPCGRDRTEIILLADRSIRLANGDGFCFVDAGSIIGFRGDVCEGRRILCKRVSGLRPGMTLWRNISVEFEKETERNRSRRLIPVRLGLRIIPAAPEYPSGSAAPSPSRMTPDEADPRIPFRLVIDAQTEDGRTVSLERTEVRHPAEDAERMRNLLRTQLEKTAGDYVFRLAETDAPQGLPLLPAATVNALRRDIAEALDARPCGTTPLRNIPPRPFPSSADKPLSETVRHSFPKDPGGPKTAGEAHKAGIAASYKANVANALAEAVYRAWGAGDIAPAYELAHPADAELMRTKYCIRYELGLCPVRQGARDAGPLFLLNNGRRLALGFDCKACEMTVRQG